MQFIRPKISNKIYSFSGTSPALSISIESASLLSGVFGISKSPDIADLLALYAAGVRETLRVNTALGSLVSLVAQLPRIGFERCAAIDGFFCRHALITLTLRYFFLL